MKTIKEFREEKGPIMTFAEYVTLIIERDPMYTDYEELEGSLDSMVEMVMALVLRANRLGVDDISTSRTFRLWDDHLVMLEWRENWAREVVVEEQRAAFGHLTTDEEAIEYVHQTISLEENPRVVGAYVLDETETDPEQVRIAWAYRVILELANERKPL